MAMFAYALPAALLLTISASLGVITTLTIREVKKRIRR
jgi:hypothetical protein